MAKQSTWRKTRLGDVCHFIRGVSYKGSELTTEGNGAILINLKCISKGGGFNPKGVKYFNGSFSQDRTVQNGDLVIANTDLTREGDISGAPLYIENISGKAVISMDISKLQPSEQVDKNYLYFKLREKAARNFMQSCSSGSTVLHLSIPQAKLFEFELPLLPEQKTIARTLTAVQIAITEQKKLIVKLEELKQSMMKNLFTRGTKGEKVKMTEIGDIPKSWRIVPLGQHLKKTTTKDPSKAPDESFTYIDVSAVSRERLQIVSSQKLLGRDAPSRARKHIQTGDIIFATVRPTLQRIAIVPAVFNDQVCSTGYCVIRPQEDLDTNYLFYYLCSDAVLNHVEGLQSGASYPAIRDGVLFEMNIPFPTKEEQKIIGATLSSISQRIELTQEKLSAYQNLFKTLLHELMSGERRIKNI